MSGILSKILMIGFGLIMITSFLLLVSPFFKLLEEFQVDVRIQKNLECISTINLGIKEVVENPLLNFSCIVEMPENFSISTTGNKINYSFIIKDQNYIYSREYSYEFNEFFYSHPGFHLLKIFLYSDHLFIRLFHYETQANIQKYLMLIDTINSGINMVIENPLLNFSCIVEIPENIDISASGNNVTYIYFIENEKYINIYNFSCIFKSFSHDQSGFYLLDIDFYLNKTHIRFIRFEVPPNLQRYTRCIATINSGINQIIENPLLNFSCIVEIPENFNISTSRNKIIYSFIDDTIEYIHTYEFSYEFLNFFYEGPGFHFLRIDRYSDKIHIKIYKYLAS